MFKRTCEECGKQFHDKVATPEPEVGDNEVIEQSLIDDLRTIHTSAFVNGEKLSKEERHEMEVFIYNTCIKAANRLEDAKAAIASMNKPAVVDEDKLKKEIVEIIFSAATSNAKTELEWADDILNAIRPYLRDTKPAQVDEEYRVMDGAMLESFHKWRATQNGNIEQSDYESWKAGYIAGESATKPVSLDVAELIKAFEAVDKATSDIRMAMPLWVGRDGVVRFEITLDMAQPFMRNSADFCQKIADAKKAIAALSTPKQEAK